jgi:uncharacterized protein (UPF0248 family)
MNPSLLSLLKDDERVITFEQAERLRELGVKQVSQFAWYPDPDTGELQIGYTKPMEATNWREIGSEYIAAFDMTELMYMIKSLPDHYVCDHVFAGFEKDGCSWWADEINQAMFPTGQESVHMSYGKCPAEALGGTLIKAIEAGRVPITWDYFNNRFQSIEGLTPYRRGDKPPMEP